MLRLYVKATDLLDRLRNDKDGVVSFEYVIVASVVVIAVATAFGSGKTGAIESALSTGISNIVSYLPAAS